MRRAEHDKLMEVIIKKVKKTRDAGQDEYARNKELVCLLARNLALEDVLWEEISLHIRDVDLRT